MDAAIASGMIGGAVSVVLCTYISKSVRQSEVEGGLQFSTFLIVLAWSYLQAGLSSTMRMRGKPQVNSTQSRAYLLASVLRQPIASVSILAFEEHSIQKASTFIHLGLAENSNAGKICNLSNLTHWPNGIYFRSSRAKKLGFQIFSVVMVKF